MRAIIEKLIDRQDLTIEETTDVIETIATGQADPVQTGAFLALLKAKGESATEVTAFVKVMLQYCITIDTEDNSSVPCLDIVGTGGDGANTVNLSTGAAILAAACGARVAKHGNRSVSSRSGSADVLEAMGIPMLLPEFITTCLKGCNIAFMYSPYFHPAMKHVVPVRRALGVRTVFNILGPLLNPARCKRMMVGVYSHELLDLFGQVFQMLEVDHALVIHCMGLDELNPMGIAEAVEVTKEKGICRIQIDPRNMGIPICALEDLKGGDAEENSEILQSVFSGGSNAENAIGHTIALNAGAGNSVKSSLRSIFHQDPDV